MNNPGRLGFLFCFFIVFFSSAVAQTPAPAPADKSARTNIDETFYLNIIERRLTEQDFKAATAVSTDPNSGLDLQVGVGLSASRIDVHMRNIRGTVRFQGTLDRILRLLRDRPASPQPVP
jgi:hypothetical protein